MKTAVGLGFFDALPKGKLGKRIGICSIESCQIFEIKLLNDNEMEFRYQVIAKTTSQSDQCDIEAPLKNAKSKKITVTDEWIISVVGYGFMNNVHWENHYKIALIYYNWHKCDPMWYPIAD